MKGGNIVKCITDYIEAHLDEDLSLEGIAESLHYSKFYMARMFALVTGVTFGKYFVRRWVVVAG